jgi:hypothetical protein
MGVSGCVLGVQRQSRRHPSNHLLCNTSCDTDRLRRDDRAARDNSAAVVGLRLALVAADARASGSEPSGGSGTITRTGADTRGTFELWQANALQRSTRWREMLSARVSP